MIGRNLTVKPLPTRRFFVGEWIVLVHRRRHRLDHPLSSRMRAYVRRQGLTNVSRRRPDRVSPDQQAEGRARDHPPAAPRLPL
jgi:hypothetical protein